MARYENGQLGRLAANQKTLHSHYTPQINLVLDPRVAAGEGVQS